MTTDATGTTHGYAERYAASLMNTFGPPKLVLARGEGARVWDVDGKEYVDLLAGVAVNALGHGHPALVEAVKASDAARCSPSSPSATSSTPQRCSSSPRFTNWPTVGSSSMTRIFIAAGH